MKLLAAVAACLAIACTELPEVEREVCGNRVLDLDEDCDGFSTAGEGTQCGAPETDNACSFICDAENDIVCPEGWGCGADGRCRRAAGKYIGAPGSPWDFRATDLAVGDIDGDGNVDLVGNTVSSIQLRYGTEDGEFPSQRDLPIRPPTGPLSFGLFDRDQRLDVMVPTADGLLVMLGQSDGSLEPVAYSPFSVPPGELRMVPVESGATWLMTEVIIITDNFMEFLNASSSQTALPNDHVVGDLVGRVAVGDIGNLPYADRQEFVLAFAGDSKVYVYASEGFAEGENWTLHPVLEQEVDLIGASKVEQGAQLADYDGDGDLDLLVSVRDVLAASRVVVALNDGSGTFGATSYANVFDRGLGSPWPLAAGPLDSDPKADYVMSESIAIADLFVNFTVPGPPNSLSSTAYITSATWSEAVIADVNGDGRSDVAAISDGFDGVDFYLGAAADGFFNKFHVDTDGPPTCLRAGDFDGDLVADVAFVEQGQGSRPDQLAVMFGSTSGGPSAAVSMGAMGTIDWIEPLSWVVGTQGLDAITDLLVRTHSFPDGNSSAIAIMQGSSSRRMISPYVLQPSDGGDPDVPRRAFFGNFGADDDNVRDVAAIADAAIAFDSTSGGDGGGADVGPQVKESHGWLIPGTGGDGQLDASHAVSAVLPGFTEFDTPCAEWVTGDLDPTGTNDRDEVLAIDGGLTCAGNGDYPVARLLVGRAVPGETPPIDSAITEIPGDARAVRRLSLVDLDADGDLDLLAVFAGEVYRDTGVADGTITGAALMVFWNQDGDISVDDTTFLSLEDQAPVLDAAAIHDQGADPPTLLVLTEDGIYSTQLGEDGQYQPLVQRIGADLDKNGRIAVADVDSDGIEDFVFTDGSSAEVRLGVQMSPLGAEQGMEE